MGEYEKETGTVIVERFKDVNYVHTPGVLVKNHGPFSWGKDPDNAVYNAVVMEQVAKMAFVSFSVNPDTTILYSLKSISAANTAPMLITDKRKSDYINSKLIK